MLDSVGGYDPAIGVGASTPWQACEGQDLMLRALAKGYACWFDPTIFGHHAELDIADPAMVRKGRGYARGLGYVLRLHGYPLSDACKWILRPAVRAALSLMTGKRQLFAYFASVAIGRLEGWRMRVPSATDSDLRRTTAPDAAMPTSP